MSKEEIGVIIERLTNIQEDITEIKTDVKSHGQEIQNNKMDIEKGRGRVNMILASLTGILGVLVSVSLKLFGVF